MHQIFKMAMAINYSRDTAAIPGDTAAIQDVHQFLRCPILPQPGRFSACPTKTLSRSRPLSAGDVSSAVFVGEMSP